MGSGPFTPEQQHNYDKLHEILHKAQDSLLQSQQQVRMVHQLSPVTGKLLFTFEKTI
jgi:hypothetical protein